MKKQLTAEQIDQLVAFAESKHVHYLDLQYEIVDHLASAVEDELAAYPFLSFERALERVYGRFPVTGFMQWMEQKEESLTKYWKGRQRKYMLRFMKPPQIFALLASIYIMAQVFLSQDMLLIGGLMSMYLVSTLYFAWRNRSMYIRQQTGSPLMVQDAFYKTVLFCNFSGAIMALAFILDSGLGSIFSPMSTFNSYYFASAMTFIIIYNYASATAFPAMLQEELEQKYSFINLSPAS